MLCPEVVNFKPPKIITSSNQCGTLEQVTKTIRMNSFYKTVIVTCPDELQLPVFIQESLLEDNDYYKISNCPLTEFLEPIFIENFVKAGSLYCFSIDRNCITQNCAAITPDGVLTIHVIEFIYQTLGLEGTKRDHGFYEVRIDLKNLKHVDKLKFSFTKLEQFDFNILWEPTSEDICPSSVAKYFHDNGLSVALYKTQAKTVNPLITEIPSIDEVDIEDMVEWIGMLSHEVSMEPTDAYISTYGQPECTKPIKSSRITLLIVKGIFTPRIIDNVCKNLLKYVNERELDNYWCSVSIQSYENCLWQWNKSSPKMFQCIDSTCNIFVTKSDYKLYSVGQLKYS